MSGNGIKCYWALQASETFVLHTKGAIDELCLKAQFDNDTGSLSLVFRTNCGNTVLSNDVNELKSWEQLPEHVRGKRFIYHMRHIKRSLVDLLGEHSLEYQDIAEADVSKIPKQFHTQFYQSMKDLLDLYFRLA